ncbi:MAG: hypothetical protein EHM80_12180 [Nitrospiraceae bacterium]|nr:MAG: hypothetical protein EHM80_12180 [Nitrospiraceae bacterium]
MANGESEDRKVFNYCVSFIDLLGQRNAAKGQGLLPRISSEAEDKAFQKILLDNIGGILELQRDVEEMGSVLSPDPNSPLRESLSDEERIVWDELQRKSVNTQYWSDGFVKYACLGNPEIKCPVNGVFEIFCTAGYFCLLGLVRHRPVRGAIDIAWGAEIRPGELYGPAIIRAYELESEVAQYPRIVIGHEVLRFLETHRSNSGDEPAIRANQEFARRCLDMLVQDDDGYWILHYLGDALQHAATHAHHNNLYQKARTFVVNQIEEHKRLRNSKLAFRYTQLFAYFDAYSPRPEDSQEC